MKIIFCPDCGFRFVMPPLRYDSAITALCFCGLSDSNSDGGRKVTTRYYWNFKLKKFEKVEINEEALRGTLADWETNWKAKLEVKYPWTPVAETKDQARVEALRFCREQAYVWNQREKMLAEMELDK